MPHHNEMRDPSGNRFISLEEACRRYRNRFTMEFLPNWAKKPKPNGKYPAPHYASDQEWYDRTEFMGEGTLAVRKYARSSHPTWPLGVAELDKPYDGTMVKNVVKKQSFPALDAKGQAESNREATRYVPKNRRRL